MDAILNCVSPCRQLNGQTRALVEREAGGLLPDGSYSQCLALARMLTAITDEEQNG